jgi:hypothetical protein
MSEEKKEPSVRVNKDTYMWEEWIKGEWVSLGERFIFAPAKED